MGFSMYIQVLYKTTIVQSREGKGSYKVVVFYISINMVKWWFHMDNKKLHILLSLEQPVKKESIQRYNKKQLKRYSNNSKECRCKKTSFLYTQNTLTPNM